MSLRLLVCAAVSIVLTVSLPLHAQTPAQPEAATGFAIRPAASAKHAMVVTANPHATDAALAVLRDGGSAADAAIAAALVLNVVEPQSSGLGGGGFLLHYSAADGRMSAWDGRETAPADVDASLFLDASGKPLGFHDAAVGGRAVGVPGLAKLLGEAHRQHGRMPWARLFAPAIALAEEGFPVSPRLHALISGDRFLAKDAQARALFYDAGGAPLAVGARLRNPRLAEVLRVLARDGADAFYRGDIAAAIVDAVNAGPNPGTLSLADFAAYRVIRRDALCGPYRGWRVCGMPPPSSGGGTVLAMLGLLSRFPLAAIDPEGAFPRHLFAEAGRLAFADRDAWYGDPRAMPLSPAQLLDVDYIGARAQQIALDSSLRRAQAGQPEKAQHAVPAVHPERASTSHVSIVDAAGNAVSMTISIEDAFGSRRMVRGMLLNNQLTDFSFVPKDVRGLHPNRVEPGKRPRSSMAPTLLFAPDGRLHAVLGSPGGSAIINFVTEAVIGLVDWHMAPDALLARPHVGSRNGPTEVENTAQGRALASRLALFGQETVVRDLTSGIGLVVRAPQGWRGAADPRREGVAAGL